MLKVLFYSNRSYFDGKLEISQEIKYKKFKSISEITRYLNKFASKKVYYLTRKINYTILPAENHSDKYIVTFEHSEKSIKNQDFFTAVLICDIDQDGMYNVIFVSGLDCCIHLNEDSDNDDNVYEFERVINDDYLYNSFELENGDLCNLDYIILTEVDHIDIVLFCRYEYKGREYSFSYIFNPEYSLEQARAVKQIDITNELDIPTDAPIKILEWDIREVEARREYIG